METPKQINKIQLAEEGSTSSAESGNSIRKFLNKTIDPISKESIKDVGSNIIHESIEASKEFFKQKGSQRKNIDANTIRTLAEAEKFYEEKQKIAIDNERELKKLSKEKYNDILNQRKIDLVNMYSDYINEKGFGVIVENYPDFLEKYILLLNMGT